MVDALPKRQLVIQRGRLVADLFFVLPWAAGLVFWLGASVKKSTKLGIMGSLAQFLVFSPGVWNPSDLCHNWLRNALAMATTILMIITDSQDNYGITRSKLPRPPGAGAYNTSCRIHG